jgi:hypothetical protein
MSKSPTSTLVLTRKSSLLSGDQS